MNLIMNFITWQYKLTNLQGEGNPKRAVTISKGADIMQSRYIGSKGDIVSQ